MFKTSISRAATQIETALADIMAPMADQPVIDGMRYACLGGKRLRGFLVMEGARLHGIAPEQSVIAACAAETLHAYSLVHDDLPCMDD
ncbi:MAG: polyprenyl synthetase family protein, partial [Pseudoruegeria sp.]